MNFRRLSPLLGAECFEPLRFPLSDSDAAEIRAAFAQHGVLVFRNQRGVSGDGQLELTKLFGELLHDRAGRYTTIDGPLATVEHRLEEGFANVQDWHCDGLFSSAPFAAICLQMTERPQCGGDTLFCSFDAMYDSFSAPLKALLREVTVRYSLFQPVSPRRYLPLPNGAPVDLPLVVRRGERESMFFSPMVACDIPQLSLKEAQHILGFLRQEAHGFQHHLRLRWAAGDVVIFDNTAVCHAVALDYFPAVRKVSRVVAKGTPLVAAGNLEVDVRCNMCPLRRRLLDE